MKFRYDLILCLSVVLLAGCQSTSTDPATMFPTASEAQLFKDGQNAMLDGKYDQSVQYFETLEARYPFGQYTEQAHLDMIYSYYKNDDTSSALAAADEYIHLYPREKNVDYAYYMRGMMEYDQNHGSIERYFGVDFAERDLASLRQAFSDFNRLLHYFPNSQYAPDTRQRMIYIRNMLARHELKIANYYFDHQAYVAAANRANDIVKHYQASRSVPDALNVMVKSYRALNLDAQAESALKVLKANYPGYK